MNKAHDAVDKAVVDTKRLRRLLKNNNAFQVRSNDEMSLVKASVYTWFNNYLPEIKSFADEEFLQNINTYYKELISFSDRSTKRSKYDIVLKIIIDKLIEIRGDILVPIVKPSNTSDAAPDFTHLIHDKKMKMILDRRWQECVKCINADAPLSATVMMGGLLEALLLARINKETDKTTIFNASKSPKDKKTGKTLQLKEWTLRNYIEVAHELKWISSSVKDIGEVLRDYRNYIHPQKELSHGIVIERDDAILFWEISKSITRQLLK